MSSLNSVPQTQVRAGILESTAEGTLSHTDVISATHHSGFSPIGSFLKSFLAEHTPGQDARLSQISQVICKREYTLHRSYTRNQMVVERSGPDLPVLKGTALKCT